MASWARLAHYTLYIVLATIGISLMVNAPGLFYGYGPVFVAMVYAAWAFPPATGAILFGVSHAAALGVLLPSKSIFPIVAFASLFLRTPFIYIAGVVREKRGLFASGLFLLAADVLIALSIALLYFGDNGIHVSLAIYEAFLLPFAYAVYIYSRQETMILRSLGLLGSLAALTAYYLSVYAFPSPPGIVGGLVALALLLGFHSRLASATPAQSIALLVISLLVPLIGLGLGGGPLAYNVKAAFYPFNPLSWSEDRWKQLSPECPPASNVFNETYDPERLRIIDTCRVVEGVVIGPPFITGDGDYCFDLEPSPQYKGMLSIGSIVLRKSRLHIEIVPADQEKLLSQLGGGLCPGDRVRVKGVFVIDTDHGLWAEIHPVITIEVLERASNQTWPECVIGRVDWAGTGE